MRINGFSGMDIDSMVKSLMTAKRIPLDTLNQQKTITEWTRDSYRELNSKIVDFRNNKLFKYGNSSEMNTQKAVVKGNADAVKAEATATSNGIEMSVEVTQLATRTTLTTAGATTTGSQLTSSTTLGELNGGSTGKTYTLKINGESFSFKGERSISSVITEINSNSKAGATAVFDELTGELQIHSKAYGETSTLTDADSGDNTLLTLFGGIQVNSEGETITAGKNSKAIINGTTIERNSNTFTVNGTKLTLIAETGTDLAIITTQSDPQKAFDTIKSLVDDYNNLLSYMNNKIGEERYRSFQPLTDEQKKEMKEKEIEQWEAKARSGLLKNDEILKFTVQAMRNIITDNLGDLSGSGITTGKYHENGKLIIDEAKLKQALTDNPQQIMDLFQGSSTAPNTGIIDKLMDQMNVTLDRFSEKAGTNKFSTDLNSTFKLESIMGEALKNYNKRISDMTSRLARAEAAFYKQFTAMETAMSRFDSQSASLANYFQ
ncbi:flagellar filament capping protein FliD [Paenibacillus sp. JSM ZJ436]|uniref:flagellar filament capping protein FliD n=1 Tax=Paenibacillus sp. JSM ZJ436 TaxID=3376190 RepID=UPI0037A611F5